jgi:hypothetical protein
MMVCLAQQIQLLREQLLTFLPTKRGSLSRGTMSTAADTSMPPWSAASSTSVLQRRTRSNRRSRMFVNVLSLVATQLGRAMQIN